MKPIIGERVGSATYPVFVSDKTKEFPIGFAIKTKTCWVGVRQSHAFERPTRRDVVEALMLAERKWRQKSET